MKLSEYQRSTSSFDLGQRSLRFQNYMFDFGLYTQVSDSGPWILLFYFFITLRASTEYVSKMFAKLQLYLAKTRKADDYTNMPNYGKE